MAAVKTPGRTSPHCILPKPAVVSKDIWRWRSEVAVGPPNVHNETLAGTTVFLHDEHADPLAGLHSETAALLPVVAEKRVSALGHEFCQDRVAGSPQQGLLLQCDTGLPTDKTLHHRTTVHRVEERDQVTAAAGETHSRGTTTSTAPQQLRTGRSRVRSHWSCYQVPRVNRARNTVDQG